MSLETSEFITDPLFSTFGRADSKWHLQQHETVQLCGKVDRDAFKIVQTGGQGVHWHGEFCYASFALQSGMTVHLSFGARSQLPTGFSAWIGQFESPWSSLIRKEDHFGQRCLDAEWKWFSFHARIQSDESQARLNFVFGEKDNTIWFKDISLKNVSR